MSITGTALEVIKKRMRGEEREEISTSVENKTAVKTYNEDVKNMKKGKKRSAKGKPKKKDEKKR